MDANARELEGEFIRVSNDLSPVEAYGLWDSLLGLGSADEVIGVVPAHDGDFFPESPFHYIDALRASVSNQGFRAPVRVDIDITQVCNSSCTFCFSRPYQIPGYRGQKLDAEAVWKLLIELRSLGTSSVRFCGGGDPLLHPDVDELIVKAKALGFLLTIITNGDYLNHREGRIERIVENVAHLRWSANAVSNETRRKVHQPNRGTASFSDVKDSIRKIIRQRASTGGGRSPMIWATFLLVPENIHEAVTAVNEFRAIGVDSVSFRPVFHGFHGSWSRDQLDALPGLYSRLRSYSEPSEFYVYTPKRNLTELSLDPNVYFDSCLSRTLRTVVEAHGDGGMIQSCGIYRGNATTGMPLGKRASTFQSAWKTFQNCPRPASAPKDCGECIDISMNRTLAQLYEILKVSPEVGFVRAKRGSVVA